MAGIKIVDSFDHTFTLDPKAKEHLFQMLEEDEFCQTICDQAQCDRAEFTRLLFQPAPYTATATKGMPVEYETYHHSPDHIIINVPPPFMFTAKIFKPSRLCAIYQIKKNRSF